MIAITTSIRASAISALALQISSGVTARTHFRQSKVPVERSADLLGDCSRVTGRCRYLTEAHPGRSVNRPAGPERLNRVSSKATCECDIRTGKATVEEESGLLMPPQHWIAGGAYKVDERQFTCWSEIDMVHLPRKSFRK